MTRYDGWPRGDWLGAVTLIAIVLVAFDSAATYLHLTLGHAVEGNLVVARMIDHWGAEAGLAIRTLQVTVLVLGLAWLARRSRMAWQGLLGVTVVLGAVAVYHVVGSAFLV